MAAFVGSFVANTSTGNQAISGLGFEPDTVIFLATTETGAGAGTGDASVSFGAATRAATSQAFTVGYFEEDAGTASATAHYFAETAGNVDRCLSIIETTTTACYADFVSMDTGGFTINWTTAPSAAYLVFFLAFTAEQVEAGFHNPPTLGETSDEITDETSSYQPTFVLMSGRAGASGLAANAGISIGAATSATERGSTLIISADSRPTRVEASVQRTDSVMLYVDQFFAGDADGSRLDINSFNSDGFTSILDVTGDLSPGGQPTAFLAPLLPAAKVGSDTQRTSTGTKSVTGLGFQPDALLLFSWGQASSTSQANDANLSIGLVGSNGERSAWVGGVADSDPIQVGSAASDTKALMFIDTPGTVVAEADCTLDDNGFTLDWTTADGTAREFIYLAFQSYGFVADVFVPQIYRTR